jgi:hypothetical protein
LIINSVSLAPSKRRKTAENYLNVSVLTRKLNVNLEIMLASKFGSSKPPIPFRQYDFNMPLWQPLSYYLGISK